MPGKLCNQVISPFHNNDESDNFGALNIDELVY
jgi:hypothetical protein